MRPVRSGPATCSSFSVSSRTDSEFTWMIPSRSKSARAPASDPASEAVCDTVAVCACSEAPIFSATIRLPRRCAVSAMRTKAAQVVDPFDVQPQRGDARVLQKRRPDLGQPGLRLVPGGHGIGQRQAAPLHRQVDRDVRGLGDDGHAAFLALAAVLVGPEGGAVEVVEEPVAVRPENAHLAGRADKAVLQVGAVGQFRHRLAKARGKADRAARAHGG